MTMTKAQIVEMIQEQLGYPRNTSADLIEILLEIIKRSLESGDDVMISGFGKFCVNQKKARKGRNPATGDEMMLAARRIITFKCSGKLKEKLNK
jgi:integration host factor subunit alpha